MTKWADLSDLSKERQSKKRKMQYLNDDEFRQKHLEYNRQYRLAHPKPHKERRDKTLNKTYDLTAYHREYRRTHRERINAYMREYLKTWRLKQKKKNDNKRTA